MRRIVLPIVLLAFVSGQPALADGEAVYESLSDVVVGRVFFSAPERERLDAIRDRKPLPAVKRVADVLPGSRVEDSDAAGYFVDAEGKARVYRDGEFVAVDDSVSVDFPNEVKVVRGPEPKSAGD